MVRKNLSLLMLSALSIGFVGCGGGGSSTFSEIQTGTFVDAPVEGLSYKTATQSGFTDAQGHFKYKDGESIEFKLGTLVLGKGKADSFVTPYTISNNTTTAINIALLLQNFDSNRSNTQVLNVSKLKDYNFTDDDFNLSATSTDIEDKLQILYADNNFEKYRDRNNTLLTATEVKNNMDDYIQTLSTPTNNTNNEAVTVVDLGFWGSAFSSEIDSKKPYNAVSQDFNIYYKLSCQHNGTSNGNFYIFSDKSAKVIRDNGITESCSVLKVFQVTPYSNINDTNDINATFYSSGISWFGSGYDGATWYDTNTKLYYDTDSFSDDGQMIGITNNGFQAIILDNSENTQKIRLYSKYQEIYHSGL